MSVTPSFVCKNRLKLLGDSCQVGVPMSLDIVAGATTVVAVVFVVDVEVMEEMHRKVRA